jgi:hypothetical protein
MPKYYINSGTLQFIYSTNKNPLDAACCVIWELNENDTLQEYMFVDERGHRNVSDADDKTIVFDTNDVLKKAGWSIDT